MIYVNTLQINKKSHLIGGDRIKKDAEFARLTAIVEVLASVPIISHIFSAGVRCGEDWDFKLIN